MKSGNFPAKQASRRLRVIERLEKQLQSKTKRVINEFFSLTDSDIKRIEKEIEVLNSRIPISPRGLRSKKHSGTRRSRF